MSRPRTGARRNRVNDDLHQPLVEVCSSPNDSLERAQFYAVRLLSQEIQEFEKEISSITRKQSNAIRIVTQLQQIETFQLRRFLVPASSRLKRLKD